MRNLEIRSNGSRTRGFRALGFRVPLSAVESKCYFTDKGHPCMDPSSFDTPIFRVFNTYSNDQGRYNGKASRLLLAKTLTFPIVSGVPELS